MAAAAAKSPRPMTRPEFSAKRDASSSPTYHPLIKAQRLTNSSFNKHTEATDQAVAMQNGHETWWSTIRNFNAINFQMQAWVGDFSQHAYLPEKYMLVSSTLSWRWRRLRTSWASFWLGQRTSSTSSRSICRTRRSLEESMRLVSTPVSQSSRTFVTKCRSSSRIYGMHGPACAQDKGQGRAV